MIENKDVPAPEIYEDVAYGKHAMCSFTPVCEFFT